MTMQLMCQLIVEFIHPQMYTSIWTDEYLLFHIREHKCAMYKPYMYRLLCALINIESQQKYISAKKFKWQ